MTSPGLWPILAGSISLVAYTYFGYPVLLSLLRSLAPSPSIPEFTEFTEKELPAITMILSAFNEELVMEEKVTNFLKIDYPNDRILLWIGSDGSQDNTVQIARDAAQNDPRILIKDFQENRGKVNVINDLMSQVKTPIVILSDANTLYAPNSIRHLVKHFAEERVGGVCARLQLTHQDAESCEEEGLYWRYETFLKKAESDLGTLSSINGQAFAFRKDLYVSLPPDSITEDQHLGLSILARGHRIRFDSQAIVTEPIGNLQTEQGRRLRISAGNFQTLFRAGLPLLNPLRGFACFAYVSHKVIRWFVPLFLLIALVTSGLLWNQPAGQVLFLLQIAFYLLALIPSALPGASRLRFLRLIHYFLIMNWTIVRGFWRYLLGRQRVAWDRTART